MTTHYPSILRVGDVPSTSATVNVQPVLHIPAGGALPVGYVGVVSKSFWSAENSLVNLDFLYVLLLLSQWLILLVLYLSFLVDILVSSDEMSCFSLLVLYVTQSSKIRSSSQWFCKNVSYI